MSDTQQVVATELIGKKGYPRHYAALDLEPPMKVVPVEDGQPQTNHPGLSLEDQYRLVIQSHLDTTAQQRQYDRMQTAISYRGDPNPQYAAEADALFIWRSEVWTYAMAELAKVESGARAIPTVDEFIAELPAFVWP
ncbi:hypothetical protein G3A39_41595 [Paraburkholderia aspalathi]|nr:hypothetical protein [Paraburkholderia aspalathi]